MNESRSRSNFGETIILGNVRRSCEFSPHTKTSNAQSVAWPFFSHIQTCDVYTQVLQQCALHFALCKDLDLRGLLPMLARDPVLELVAQLRQQSAFALEQQSACPVLTAVESELRCCARLATRVATTALAVAQDPRHCELDRLLGGDGEFGRCAARTAAQFFAQTRSSLQAQLEAVHSCVRTRALSSDDSKAWDAAGQPGTGFAHTLTSSAEGCDAESSTHEKPSLAFLACDERRRSFALSEAAADAHEAAQFLAQLSHSADTWRAVDAEGCDAAASTLRVDIYIYIYISADIFTSHRFEREGFPTFKGSHQSRAWPCTRTL